MSHTFFNGNPRWKNSIPWWICLWHWWRGYSSIIVWTDKKTVYIVFVLLDFNSDHFHNRNYHLWIQKAASSCLSLLKICFGLLIVLLLGIWVYYKHIWRESKFIAHFCIIKLYCHTSVAFQQFNTISCWIWIKALCTVESIVISISIFQQFLGSALFSKQCLHLLFIMHIANYSYNFVMYFIWPYIHRNLHWLYLGGLFFFKVFTNVIHNWITTVGERLKEDGIDEIDEEESFDEQELFEGFVGHFL